MKRLIVLLLVIIVSIITVLHNFIFPEITLPVFAFPENTKLESLAVQSDGINSYNDIFGGDSAPNNDTTVFITTKGFTEQEYFWEDTEYACNVEIYGRDGKVIINQNAGIVYDYDRNITLIARRLYGKGKFKAPVFSSVSALGNALEERYEYDRLFISPYEDINMTLLYAARTAGYTDTLQCVPAYIYVDGVPKGQMLLWEKFSGDNIDEVYGGDNANYEIIEKYEQIETGELFAFSDFKYYYNLALNGLESDEAFSEFCGGVDLDSFLLYSALMYVHSTISGEEEGGFSAWRYFSEEYGITEAINFESAWHFEITGKHIQKNSEASETEQILSALLLREDMKYRFFNAVFDICGYFTDSPEIIYEKLSKNLGIKYSGESGFYNIIMVNGAGAKTRLSSKTLTESGETVSAEYPMLRGVELETEIYTGYEFLGFSVNGRVYDERNILLTPDMADINGEIRVEVLTFGVSECPVYISEICAGEGIDYIKLYNPNSEPFTLRNFYLTDEESKFFRWEIPVVTLKPQSELIISMKNNKSAYTLKRLQTNFNLKSGELLLLVKNNGDIIDSADVGAAPDGKALRRQYDGKFLIGRKSVS